MANTPKRHPSGRRKKPEKTIDLEANPEKADDAAQAGQDAGAEEASGKPQPDAAKADTDKAGLMAASVDDKSQSANVKPGNGEQAAGAKKSDQAGSAKVEKVSREDTPQGNAGRGMPMVEKSKTGSSILSMLLSGLVGGAVTLGGLGILNNTGNLQGVPVIGGLFSGQGGSGEIEAANAKIADIAARLDVLSAVADSGAGEGDVSATIAELSAKIGAVEEQLADSAQGAWPETAQTVEQALATAEAAAQKADATSAQIAELNERIVDSGGGTSVDMDALKTALSGESQALAQRLDALEARLGEAAANGDTATELAAVRQDLSVLDGLGAKVDALGARTEELAGGLENARQTLTVLGERLGSLEASVNDKILPSMGEVEKAASAAIESQKVARSVSARALGNVLEQGGRFASELAAAEALAGGIEAIAALKPLAESGISTNSDLLSSFQAVSDQILTAEATDSEGGGILDKFMASARTLVQVRPSGPVSGDSTTAVLSRIEAALISADLPAARSEWDNLNDAAKAVSTQWVAALDDRIMAKSLIETVIGELSAEQTGQQE